MVVLPGVVVTPLEGDVGVTPVEGEVGATPVEGVVGVTPVVPREPDGATPAAPVLPAPAPPTWAIPCEAESAANEATLIAPAKIAKCFSCCI